MWCTICAALPSSRLEWPNGIRAPRGQPLEPGIAIDPQDALKAAEMRRRSLGLTIRAVEVYSRRRLWTGPRPIVARIHPQPACLGPTTAGVEHRDRRIVGEELGGGEDVCREPGMQRLQPSTGAADGREAMAAGTERSHANILPYSPLTPGLVSVTMRMAHNDSVTVAGEMRKNISKCDAPHTLLVR